METAKDKQESKRNVTDFSEIYTLYTVQLEGQASPLPSDLDILISNELLKVHKIILAKNEVFKVMLDSPMIESTKNRMEIPDCDLTAFKRFLIYLYTSQMPAEDINFDLLMIAEKYLDVPLKKLCLEKLSGEISIENVVEVAQLATQFNFEELITACQQFFTKNYKKMIGSPQLKDILENKPLLSGIVKEFQNERIAAAEKYDELLASSKTRKFILDGLDTVIYDNYCDDCMSPGDDCDCRNSDRFSGYGSIAHSLRFFAEDVEWSMKISYSYDDVTMTIGITLMAENKQVRADVRLTVLSKDPKFPNITVEKENQQYGSQFFELMDRDILIDRSDAYTNHESEFTLELFINVLNADCENRRR